MADADKLKGKAKNEFNFAAAKPVATEAKKLRGKATNDFNLAASVKEKQDDTGKRDNSETLSKEGGPEADPEMKAETQNITEDARKKKGAEIHKKSTNQKAKPPSHEPSP